MSEQTSHAPATEPGALWRILTDRDYRKQLSSRSGLSSVTLRQIAETGRVNSYVTALALEYATEGQVLADQVTSAQTKGFVFYSNPTARALLLMAMKEGTTLARLLGRHMLTTTDLWTFVNAQEGKCEETKERVRSVLKDLGIPTSQEVAQ
jgi:hypothetical protein